MKILIIDDDLLLVELLTESLSSDGITVRAAHDGLSGIECMINESPDMILLDIMMPGIDGFEVCKKIKEAPCTADLPIVFISAKDSQEDIDRAYALGADDYIVKPFDTITVGKRLKTVYQRCKKNEK